MREIRIKNHKKDILIIDDTADNLRVLSSILIREGYTVRKALNWQMAMTACHAVVPDLILLDIMMPEIDGYQVCQRLKAWNLTADIPVIFVSALDDVFDKVRAFQAGGVDYITKPFEFEEVLVRVQNHLALRDAKIEILNLNSRLEQRVQRRTKELEDAMQKLQAEINSRQELQTKLLNIVLHDSLTGLPNRVLFLRKLESALNRTKQDDNYQFAVLFLDCDRFKVVNDSLGHFVGDELLIAIARRIQATLSPFDTFARFGGDEFAVLLENVTDLGMVKDLAEKIIQELSLPFKLSRYEVFMDASIGINWGDRNYEKPEFIMRDADTAMYRAKASGRARYHIFDPVMHSQAIKLLELENDLRRAVERQEFIIYYQPLVSLPTGRISGFEALIRWQHPQHGLILPTEFIPAAEEMGLIYPLTTWLLKSVCKQLRIWESCPVRSESLTISINLSARLFSNPNFLSEVDAVIHESQVNPANIELEITESVIMENSEAVRNVLYQLKQREFRLVIDDFGTGYSSLSYLHSFPLNAIKIDKSFVRRMQENKENMGLVPAMIGIAHSMGMKAIAEGIETPEQLIQLRSLNCDLGQGYLFSPAVEATRVIDLLTANPQW
ncbi:GGDEF domain-containing response regulator [Calothrix sp. PCC 6303]|uniref:two-component system response regulator n=1 Tax=Calothrix sp. PCC 6303 TaxID=1170562 RepID=UPI0002A018C7|nr:GGDEF domain-containing response regulator [Calothrix sp. PCC 6303]AFZ04456.1 response regulator receiver modulated diguanylate cyclase/phosphodiesterase [Calothrix sp. PCC 6303]